MKVLAEAEIRGILAALELARDGVTTNPAVDMAPSTATTMVGSGLKGGAGKSTLPLRFNGKVVGLVG